MDTCISPWLSPFCCTKPEKQELLNIPFITFLLLVEEDGGSSRDVCVSRGMKDYNPPSPVSNWHW